MQQPTQEPKNVQNESSKKDQQPQHHPQEQKPNRDAQLEKVDQQQTKEIKPETAEVQIQSKAKLQQMKQNVDTHELSQTQTKDQQKSNIHLQKVQIGGEKDCNQSTEKECSQSTEKVESQPKQRPIQVEQEAKNLDIKTQVQYIEQKPEVGFTIEQQVKMGSVLSGSVAYKITGFDMHGPFTILRKYSQFLALRKILLQRWPGCFVPSLNDRCQIKDPHEKQLFRFRWLQNFLLGLSQSPFMYYKEQVQLFLRTPGVDIKDMFDQMPSLKAVDIIERFKSSFGQEVQKSSTSKNGVIVSNFSTSLKKVQKNLGNLSRNSLLLADSLDHYSQSLTKMAEFLYSYQQFSLSEFTDRQFEKTICVKDNEGKIKKVASCFGRNAFYELNSLVEIQSKDAQSFLEVILAMEMFTLKRDQLESLGKEIQLQIDQIALGHKSLKVMTSRKTKEEIQAELQARQKTVISEKLVVVELFNVVEIIFATKSIGIFKDFKRKSYRKFIHNWSKNVSESTPELISIWKFINQESKVLKKKQAIPIIR